METKTKEKFTLRKSKKYKNLVSVGLGLFFVTTGGLFLNTSQADAKEQTPVQEKQGTKDTGSIEVNIKKSEEFKNAVNQAEKEGVDIKPKAEKENLGIVKNINEAKQLEQVAKDKEKADKENVEKEIQDYKSKKENYQKELEKVTNENEKRKKENEQIRKDNENIKEQNKEVDEKNKIKLQHYEFEKRAYEEKLEEMRNTTGYEKHGNIRIAGDYDKTNKHRLEYFKNFKLAVDDEDADEVRGKIQWNYGSYVEKISGGFTLSKISDSEKLSHYLRPGAYNLKNLRVGDRYKIYNVGRTTDGRNVHLEVTVTSLTSDRNFPSWNGYMNVGQSDDSTIGFDIAVFAKIKQHFRFVDDYGRRLNILATGVVTDIDFHQGLSIDFNKSTTIYKIPPESLIGKHGSSYHDNDGGNFSGEDAGWDDVNSIPHGSMLMAGYGSEFDLTYYGGFPETGEIYKSYGKSPYYFFTLFGNTFKGETLTYPKKPYIEQGKPLKPEKELLKEPKKPETPIIRYTEYKYEIKPQIEKEVKNSENQNINNRQTIKGAEVNFNLKTETLPKNREQINVFQITDTLPQNYKINLEKTKSLNKNFLIDYSKGQITFTASKQTLEKINDIEKDITPPAPTIYGNITNDETTIINEFNLNINNKYKTHSNTVEVKTPEKAESSKDVELDGELEKNTNKEKVEPKKEEKEKVEPTEKEEKRKISVKITDPSNTLSEKDRIKTFEEAETGIYKKTGELIEIKKGANPEFEVGKDFEGYIKPFKVPAGYIYNGDGHKIKAKDTNNGQINISIPLEKSHDSLWEFPKPKPQAHIRKKRSLASIPTKEETPNNIIKTLKKQLQPKEAKAEEIKEAKAGEIKEENKKQITESINFEIKPKYKTETIEEMNINTIYVLDTSGSRDEIIGKTAELTKKWFDSMKGFKTNVYQYDEKDRINKFMPKYFNKNGEIIATEKAKESFGRIENPVKQLTKEQGHNLLIFETDFIDQAMSKGINTYGNWREEKSSRVREAIDEMINEFYKINKTQTLLILDGANEIFGGNNLPHKVIDEQTGEIKGIVIDSMQDRSTTLTKTVENLVDKYKVEVPQPKKYDIEVEKDKDIDVTLTIDGQQITNSYEIKKPVAETKTLNIQAKAPKELETNKTVTVKIYEVNQGKKEEVGRKTITFKAKKQPNKNSVNGKKIIEGTTLKYKLLWDLDQYQDIAVTKEEINKGFYYIDDYPEEAVDPQPNKITITDSDGNKVEGIENKIFGNISEAPKEIQDLLAKEGIKPKGAFQLFSVKDKEKFFKDYVSKGKTLTITTPMQVKRHYVGNFKNKAYQIDFGNGYQTNEVGNRVEKVEPKKENKNKDGQKIDGKKVLEGSTSYYNLTWDLDQYQDIAVTKEEINKGFYYIDDFPEEAVDPHPENITITDSDGNKVDGIENKIYKNISEAPKEIQDLLAKEGIKPKGAFQLFSVKDKEKFFRDYVSKGKTLTITTPMQVKRHFVGEIKNKAYQIDFGNGYQTNEVGNKVEKVEPKKDVELDGEILENGGEVELNKTFTYRLRGAIVPENRGTKLEDYEFLDDYDETHDEYLGNYRVVLTDDVKLKDGKIIKKGEDITKYTEQQVNEEKGEVDIKIKQEFLDQISDDSKFSAQALLPMKRIKDGEVENTYINKINGVETKSNTVKSKTKPLPKEEIKEKPQEKALPKTGVAEKDNIKEISLITLLGVGTLYLRRKRKINK